MLTYVCTNNFAFLSIYQSLNIFKLAVVIAVIKITLSAIIDYTPLQALKRVCLYTLLKQIRV